MKQEALYRRFKNTIALLCVAIVALWAVFYAAVRSGLKDNALGTVEQVSENVIFTLESRFLSIENMSYAMAREPMLTQMLHTEDSLAFHDLAIKAAPQLEAITAADTAVSNIILYDTGGRFYRFKGGMSNTVLRSIFKELSPDSLPQNLTCTSDGMYYIGYASGIYENGDLLGCTAMLLEETEIKRIFDVYDQMPYLGIALTAGDSVVYSNQESITRDILLNKRAAAFYTEKKIGLTPFSVLVYYNNTGADRISIIFSVIMLVTVFLLFAIVIRFLQFWQRRFFHPIGGVICEVEQFDGERSRALTPTGEAYFDGLVTEINGMIVRIEEKEAELARSRELLYVTELQKQRALIISLKKQINAHFTVNTLNSVRALIKKNENDRAEEICDGLSGLLQYANAGDETITLLDEFSMLERYLAIMRARYPGKFTENLEFDDELAEARIPRMLLQPVVENAILHGFHNQDGGVLHISGEVDRDSIRLQVADNGRGMRADALQALREHLKDYLGDAAQGLSHVALPNIQTRIRASFGSDYGVTIESELGTGTRVTIILPIILPERQ